MVGLIQWIKHRLQSFGVRHRMGYVRIWFRCLFSPPPPKGRFPALSTAAKKPNGLLAIGGMLTKEILLEAYGKGIYPMFYQRPVKWWSNDPRMVLFIDRMRIEKKVRRIVRSKRFNVTFDSAFEAVIRNCGDRDPTWLTPEMVEAFIVLHRSGHAHSVEVWDMEENLVGGLYGVDLGKGFSTESLFTRVSNASKVAHAYLNCHLQQWGYVFNDMQTPSEYARRLGFETIPRNQYAHLLSECQIMDERVGKWSVDERFDVSAWIPSEPGSQLLGMEM